MRLSTHYRAFLAAGAGLLALMLLGFVLNRTGALAGGPLAAASGWSNLSATGGNTALALAVNNEPSPDLHAATYWGGVYSSLNDGVTWTNPLTEPMMTVAGAWITPTTVYAGGFDGSFWRALDGATWSQHSSGLGSTLTGAILPSDPLTMYLGADGAVYASTDGGDFWFPTGPGIPWDALVLALEDDGGVLVAGTDLSGAFRSLDYGDSWIDASTGLSFGAVNALVKAGRVLHAGTGDGVFASADQADSWISTNTGLTNSNVQALVARQRVPRVLVAGTDDGLFVSGNHGLSWAPVVEDLPAPSDNVHGLAMNRLPLEQVYAASNGGVWRLGSVAELGCRALPEAIFASPLTEVEAGDIGSIAGAWYGPLNLAKDLNEDDRNDIVDIMLTASVFGAMCSNPVAE